MTATETRVPNGILGFPVAPFKENGDLDEKALERNIQFLVNNDLSSIFIGCGSGEYQSLSEKEYKKMLEIAIDVTKRKVPVYTGVGGNIHQAILQAQVSEEYGADGYLILPPYLIQGEQEGIYQYVKSVITSTSINAIMYQRDNAVANLQTVSKLAEFPQLIGLKDGTGNMELNIELTQTLGNRLEWINGMPFAEITMPAYYNLGFNTYSSAISNYIPHISKLYFDALKQGKKEVLKELYNDVLLPINNIRKQKKGYAVSLIKAGMEIVNLPVGQTVRPPLIPVEKEHYKLLESILEKAFEKYSTEEKVQ